MRILFDAFWWVEGPISNRQVQREFIRAWATTFPWDELVLAVPSRHLETARRDVPDGARLVGTRLKPHAVAAIVDMPRIARRVHADLTLNHNFTPLTGRSATFVHDVMFQTNPEWFTRSELAYLSLVTLTLARADVVLTSTAHEAQHVRANNRKVRNVRPVGLAVGTELVDAVPAAPPRAAHLTDFVLSVGRLNVRKNLATAFEAALRSGVLSAECPLVVVGEAEGVGVGVGAGIRAAIDDGRILFIGQVSTSELAWLYQRAELLVFLSLDEGFGLPPLEALALGCPVLVSDIPVFHETLGEHAAYVDPLDVDAAAEAIARAVGDETNRPRLDGSLPTWAGCARRIRDAVTAPPCG